MTYHEKDSPFTANTQFGVAHRQMVSGEKQDYQIDGISTSFKGDEDNTYSMLIWVLIVNSLMILKLISPVTSWTAQMRFIPYLVL
tara:strand:+ start:218 stop:472 length:255 start_codon:yes stop_codon:yes gene_type:complete